MMTCSMAMSERRKKPQRPEILAVLSLLFILFQSCVCLFSET